LGSAKLTRSNLSRINENKPYQLYEALFSMLLRHCNNQTSGYRFKFKNPLYSLDDSTIELCLPVDKTISDELVREKRPNGFAKRRQTEFT